jgi:pimeloyl-ACP methyl ester carboxylesterase
MAQEIREQLHDITARDGRPLTLLNVRGGVSADRPPVLLVHGAGVRANIFRAPVPVTVVDALVNEGWDVWLLNWRASIDLEPTFWTLDQAARFDHPAAVAAVQRLTGSQEVRAVIHCQGSTSFAMAAVAGLVPDVSTIVSNAVSLHPILNRLARVKINFVLPAAGRVMGYVDPRWGDAGAPGILPKAVTAWVRAVHHECNNMVCKMASFTYGTGEPTLWRHQNLNPATHDWLRNEFGFVPMTFFKQMRRCVDAGHLVSVDGSDALPASFVAEPPHTTARFALMTGALNSCFEPESQVASHAWLTSRGDDRHTLHVIPDYGHLDIFMGQSASRDVFPIILEELERGP